MPKNAFKTATAVGRGMADVSATKARTIVMALMKNGTLKAISAGKELTVASNVLTVPAAAKKKKPKKKKGRKKVKRAEGAE